MLLNRSCSARTRANGCPPQLVAGVFALAASLAMGGPVALSIALIAWGAVRLALRHGRVTLAAVACTYGALVVLAFLAQCHAASHTPSSTWRLIAVGDAAAAVSLVTSLLGKIVR